jgi:hypothetical protein
MADSEAEGRMIEADTNTIVWIIDSLTAVGTARDRVFIVRQDDESLFWASVVFGPSFPIGYSTWDEAMDCCQNWLDNL